MANIPARIMLGAFCAALGLVLSPGEASAQTRHWAYSSHYQDGHRVEWRYQAGWEWGGAGAPVYRPHPRIHETEGLILGGLVGAFLGSGLAGGERRAAGAAAGAIAGALIGSDIGRRLDERDRFLMARSLQGSLERSPSGRETRWHNPVTGHRGAVVPRPAYLGPRGHYCREYRSLVVIGGRTQAAHGTACRMPDGSWRIVR